MQIVGEHGRSGHWRYPADALLPRPPLFCAPAELLKVSVGLPAGFLRFVSVGKKKKTKNQQTCSTPGQGISSSSYWEENEMIGNPKR